MEIGPERLSIPLPLETPAGHLDSKSISAPVKRLSDPWPASSRPDRGESILYLFYWINSILPVPRFTHIRQQATSYFTVIVFHCSSGSQPHPLPWRFLCPGFPFTFGLNIRFQSSLRLTVKLLVIKAESTVILLPHGSCLPGPFRAVSSPNSFPHTTKMPQYQLAGMELFGKHKQENIKHWEHWDSKIQN